MKKPYFVRTIIPAASLLPQLRSFFRPRARRAGQWVTSLTLAALAITTQPAPAAAVIEAWVQRYDGPAKDDDYASAVVFDDAGNLPSTAVAPRTMRPSFTGRICRRFRSHDPMPSSSSRGP